MRSVNIVYQTCFDIEDVEDVDVEIRVDEILVEDVGIGPYEFWGAKGNDSRMAVTDFRGQARIKETGEPISMYPNFYDWVLEKLNEDRVWESMQI